jgi:hypothetical protein
VPLSGQEKEGFLASFREPPKPAETADFSGKNPGQNFNVKLLRSSTIFFTAIATCSSLFISVL